MEMIFQGSFTKDELQEMLQALRDIEQRDTSRHFAMLGNFEELSVEELLDVLRSVDPPYPADMVIELRPAGAIFDEREHP